MLVYRPLRAGEEIAAMTFEGVTVHATYARSGPLLGCLVASVPEHIAKAMQAHGWSCPELGPVSPLESPEPEAVSEAAPEASGPEEAVSDEAEAVPADVSILMGSTAEIESAIEAVTDPDVLGALLEAEEAGLNRLGRPRTGVMAALLKGSQVL